MIERDWISRPPPRLLLATDLSARCDRALDRAALLAREWQAEIVAVNVRETPQDPDQILSWVSGRKDDSAVLIAQRELQRDLAGLDVRASMQIVSGDVSASVRKIAVRDDCGVVVTGMARNEILGRFLLGSTVQNLARALPVPLLVVRNRARSAYQRIVVATDFSDSSRHALQAAVRYFPGRSIVLYHAHAAPASDDFSAAAIGAATRRIEKGECAEFLAACGLPAEARSQLQVVIEAGPLATALTRYVRQHDVELVAVGSHGRSGVMDVLIGSNSARLLEWLPCDTLVVREPRAAAA